MFENLQRRSPSSSPTLLEIIGQVRRRWRSKLLLRGTLWVAGLTLLLLIAAAYGLEWARYTPMSLAISRIALIVVVLAAAAWFIVRPLRRRVTDEQVALYLEEHEPSLQSTLLSAVEASRKGHPESAALVQRVIEQAVQKCSELDAPRRIERLPIRRYGTALAATLAVVLLMAIWGPGALRNAFTAMFQWSSDLQASVVPYRIEVSPGSVSVPKGADQLVTATLIGFGAEDAVIMARRNPEQPFEAVPLLLNEKGGYEGVLFDINTPLEYYVEAEGVRSGTFTVKVVELPYVQRMDLEYRYPAYTGLEPETIEDGGDIAVLKGTEVRFTIVPTMKTTGGRLVLDKELNDGEAPAEDRRLSELTLQADGTLTGSIRVDNSGFYRVELVAPTGEHVVASTQYAIDVLTDQAPRVSFRRPGRDTTASPIEEVFVEANATDDYGVRNMELVYSVNGGPEQVVKLFEGKNRLSEVTAGHTFYLEELGVEVGDSVSYFARAADNDSASGAKQTASDLYFLTIRPFRRDFRQAQSQGGGGGGGGGGGRGGQQQGNLSDQQKMVISATHNVSRDRTKYSTAELREAAGDIGRSQARLREQVETMITRMNSELVQQDPAFEEIGRLLPQAVASMKEAEALLMTDAPDLEKAKSPEQAALRILLRAEQEFQTQISVARGGGGGGGGGGGQMQQELSELFEQQLEEMAPRYETANQSSEGGGEREIDELMERLRELARRQEQEAERQRLRALQGQTGGNSGAQQRDIAEQLDQEARRLERLARSQQRPERRQELEDAARRVQEAANAARRAAAGNDPSAQAAAQRALEQLEQTRRQLAQNQTEQLRQDLEDARQRAERLAQQQRQVADQAQQLVDNPDANRQRRADQIAEQKTDLAEGVRDLQQRLDRAARSASQQERAAAARTREAADAIRSNQISEDIERVRDALQAYAGRSPQQLSAISESLRQVEGQITRAMDDVRDRIADATEALGQSPNANTDPQQEAAERLRNLARATESMQERLRERLTGRPGEQGERGQQGREGQGQEGQGQEGQQGENGERGQRGQGQGQGQEGEGQAQGERGQRGQGQARGQGQGRGEGQGRGQGQGRGEGQQAGEGRGQGGRDGQGGQGGGRDGDLAGGRFGDGTFDGNLGAAGGINNGRWGDQLGWGGWYNGIPLTDDEIRQLRSEAGQRLADAQRLARDLRGLDIDPRELERILAQLKQLTDERIYQNVEELARRQTEVTERLKRFEYDVRRQLDEQTAVALSNTDEVPEAYKGLVEEYWRSLARSGR